VMGYYGWMGAFGGIGMLVWVAVIVLLLWSVSTLFARRDGDTRIDALEILKRRYAAGEVSSAEFETARKALAA
jgi:putative membrane protein